MSSSVHSGGSEESEESANLAQATHATIRLANRAYGESFAFNTAIAELMKLSNTLRDASVAAKELDEQYTDSIRTMLVMLSPAAPHICSELWEAMAGLPSTAQWQPELSVLQQRWPTADESKLQLDVVDLPLQINGKFRGSLQVTCIWRTERSGGAARPFSVLLASLQWRGNPHACPRLGPPSSATACTRLLGAARAARGRRCSAEARAQVPNRAKVGAGPDKDRESHLPRLSTNDRIRRAEEVTKRPLSYSRARVVPRTMTTTMQ